MTSKGYISEIRNRRTVAGRREDRRRQRAPLDGIGEGAAPTDGPAVAWRLLRNRVRDSASRRGGAGNEVITSERFVISSVWCPSRTNLKAPFRRALVQPGHLALASVQAGLPLEAGGAHSSESGRLASSSKRRTDAPRERVCEHAPGLSPGVTRSFLLAAFSRFQKARICEG
jgi:hypothetical protein